MLIIASDIHLTDGTCAKPISPSAFYLFADRLREMAYQASWRKDNVYRPVDGIDIVLMGDILDPLHSTRLAGHTTQRRKLHSTVGGSAQGWIRFQTP